MIKYEIALVVNAKLEDEGRAAVLDKVKDYVVRFGGTVSNVDEWGKRRLAYEIQKMREGYYYFIQFEAEPTTPIELERRLRIMDNVIRYLVVKQDEEAIAAAAKKKIAPAEEAVTAASAEEE